MRTVWATHLDVNLDELARARAATRRYTQSTYGIDAAGVHHDGGVTVSVTEGSGADGDRARVVQVSSEHPDDPTVLISDTVGVGADRGAGFVWCRRALTSTTPAIAGTVTFEPTPPPVLLEIAAVTGTRDGRWPAGRTPEPFDQPQLLAQITDPDRRLPVVGLTDGCGLDPDRFAEHVAGLAHVVWIGRRHNELPARFDLGLPGGAVLWWPGWPDTSRVMRWRPEDLVDRWGAGAPVIRLLAAASALRVPEPDVLTRIETAESHRQLDAARKAATGGGGGDIDALLTAWDADLSRLETLSVTVNQARTEAAQLRDENTALLAAWDDSVAAAVAATAAPGSEDRSEFDTISEVLTWADQHLEHLDVSPEAHRFGADSPYRWPQRLADALRTLDELTAAWEADQLTGGFAVAAPAAGLPWRSGVGVMAHGQYADDYRATTPTGEAVLCGPHLRFGAQTGPEGHLRCYLWIDKDRRRILVGPTGRHGRDRSNR